MSPAEAAATRPGRRKLIAVWLLLAALVIAIVLIERHDRAASTAPDTGRDERLLLPAPIEELGAIEVAQGGTLHRFERDTTGAWFYHGIHSETEKEHAHNSDSAQATRIDKAFAAFGRTRMERQFPLNIQADEFGVTRPEIFIMVYRPKQLQPLSRYAVGIVAPDNVSRYVLPVGSSWVVTIANFQIDNLLSLIQAVSGRNQPGLGTDKLR